MCFLSPFYISVHWISLSFGWQKSDRRHLKTSAQTTGNHHWLILVFDKNNLHQRIYMVPCHSATTGSTEFRIESISHSSLCCWHTQTWRPSSRVEQTSVGVWKKHKWSMKCVQRQKKKMAPPLMSDPPRTPAPPPPLPPVTDSFRQKTKNKTTKKNIRSPVNVRLPSAVVSVASRCDSTHCTSQTHFTTCQRGQAGRERSLRLTWKIREQRTRKTTSPLTPTTSKAAAWEPPSKKSHLNAARGEILSSRHFHWLLTG